MVVPTSWFRQASSFKRIDLLCRLMHISLPMERRYMASVLEEICRSDYSAIRSQENSANNLASIVNLSFNLFDEHSRAQLIVHLTLLNSLSDQKTICFYSENLLNAVREFNLKYTICKNFNRMELTKLHEDVLLLLVLSANHPAFSFYQRFEFKQLYDKLCSAFSVNTTLEVNLAVTLLRRHR